MKVQLSKRLIEKASAQAKPYELRDVQVRGLLLRVQPSGHKAWICEWTRGKRRTLGAFAHLTLDQARTVATQTVAEFVQTGLPAIAARKATNCTLRDFIDERYAQWAAANLKSGQGSVDRIRSLFPDALSMQLADITPSYIDGWLARRTAGSAVSRVTAARDIAALRSALSKAAEWKLVESHPLEDLRQKNTESRKVIRYLSADEERRLRAALVDRDVAAVRARGSANQWRSIRNRPQLGELPANGYADHLTPIVLVAMNTGLRRGELLSLLWTDIDLDRALVTVRAEHAKSGRQRHVPLNAEAFSVLTRWKLQSGSSQQVFAPKDVKTAWTRLLAKAKIEAFRFHDLRHHFASRLVMAGVDLNTVRELLGHADIKMTLRYAHLAPEHLAAAVNKLG